MSENLTPEQAVEQAASTLMVKEPSKTGGDPEVKDNEVVVEDAPTGETEQQNTETEVETDEEEQEVDPIQSAKDQLWEIFQDTNKTRAFISTLQSNLKEDTKGQTKEEKAQTVAAYRAELLKEIGQENEFLLDPVLKLLEKQNALLESKYEEKLNEIKREAIEKDTIAQYDDFMKTNKVSKETELRMEKLAKTMPADPKVPVKEYLKNLHILATHEDSKVKTNAKVAQNAKNADIKQLNSAPSEGKREPRPAKYTPQMAVQDAMNGIVRE